MKNAHLLLLLLVISFSCGNRDDSEVVEDPTYTVEDKWLWSPDPDNRTYANTMYEFLNGTRYTSYADCTSIFPCSNVDFNALDASDRIPGTEAYTFEDNTLTVDGTTQRVSFDCDGGILVFENGGKLWRLSSDCQ